MVRETTILTPNGRRYVVGPGVIDDRAVLAFTNGHCHSLAIALHSEVGGELVALRKTLEPFDHVAVRVGGGRVLDIGGGRYESDLTADGGELVVIDLDTIGGLPADHGWVDADASLAAPWVAAVQARAAAGDPYLTVGCLSYDFAIDGTLDVHLEWTAEEGASGFKAFTRAVGADARGWTRAMFFRLPRDESGEQLIDFSSAAFERHARSAERTLRANPDLLLKNMRNSAYRDQPVCL